MRIWIFLLLSSLIWAENCTQKNKHHALKLWKSSIHEKVAIRKHDLLKKAQGFCDYDFIFMDRLILEAQQDASEEVLHHLNIRNNVLNIPRDTMSFGERTKHKKNNKKQIDNLFIAFYTKQRQEEESKKSFNSAKVQDLTKRIKELHGYQEGISKALGKRGGTYEADLLFDADKSTIKNYALVNEIIAVVHQKISNDKEALFGLEGGASSEGTADYNKKLSKARGDALAQKILQKYPQYKNNLQVDVMGESELVCIGGLWAEKNSDGEYACPTQEDRVKSRRVVIRRVK